MSGVGGMDSTGRNVVVCGATGQQGGAVLEALLADGTWHVVALTRRPESEQAARLRARGVEVREADLQDRASMVRAFAGADAAYGVTTPLMPNGKIDTGPEREQGRNIVDAARENGIRHLVLSTVMYVVVGQERAIPYLQAKHDIEAYAAASGVPHTVLRPASFMDEIGGEFLPVKRGVVTGQADGDAKIPYVACHDVGVFARLAFDDPETYVGAKLNVIGDFLSGDELAATLTEVCGEPIRHRAPPMLLMHVFARQWIPLRRSFEAWGRPPHPEQLLRSLDECRRILPTIRTFEDHLRTTEFSLTPA